MKADQAIFTSIARRGKAGYHLVGKSEGLSPGEAASLEAWSPSHGGLAVDPANPISINFHQLTSGRFALSRTIEGPSEYSGRGGNQLYTQFMIFDSEILKIAGYQPFAIYRDALALGYFFYQADPQSFLQPLDLSRLHVRSGREIWSRFVSEYGRARFESLVYQIESEHPIVIQYSGDRAALAEALLSHVEPEKVARLSFATNLQPSTLRPLTLQLVGD